MKFKITEVDTLKVKVEYEDGSWALIPTLKDADKGYYAKRIVEYCNTPQDPVPVGNIPYKLRDEGTVGDDVPEVELPNPEIDASQMREALYPSLQEQFDALYHSRNGNDAQQTKIDAHIKFVKGKIPMDSTKYTVEDLDKKIEEYKPEADFYEEFVAS